MSKNDFLKAAREVERQPEELKRNFQAALQERMENLEHDVEAELAANDSVVTGTALRATDTEKWPDLSAGVRPSGKLAASHAVINDAPWAEYLEYGTGQQGVATPWGEHYPAPSAPPTLKIEHWIRMKGIRPVHYDSAWELAEAIAWQISRWGNKAHPFMKPAWRRNKPQIKQSLETAASTAWGGI